MSVDLADVIGLEAVETVMARSRRRSANVQALTGWQADPTGWIKAKLRENVWTRQQEIAESVRDHRRTAVHASFGCGKSWLAARLVCWWIDSHNPGDAFAVTTARSWPQVRAILWREINRAHTRGKLTGRVTQTEWWLGNEMVAMGRKPSDYSPDAFQGIHAKYVLVVIDEAAGVPANLWDAADGLIANEDSRILAIGNPIDPTGRFADVCQPDSGWKSIGISAFDSPNFTGEDVPDDVKAALVSKVWVDEKRKDWGEGSPAWQSMVEGRFPEESTDSVVLLSWANKCRQDPDDETAWANREPVELGVDVGAGGDETVIYLRAGTRARMVWHGQTPDSPQVSGQVVQAIRETGATAVKVDVIGIGWGVVGRLEELREQGVHSASVTGVNVADAPRDPSKFARLRDEIWWDVGRGLSRDGAWDLRETDDATIGQLIAPKYALDSAGRIKVEPKDETRRRLGRSPDRADALLLAFYEPNRLVEGSDDWAHGIIRCTNCGRGFVFVPDRLCPYCGQFRCAKEYPKPLGVV